MDVITLVNKKRRRRGRRRRRNPKFGSLKSIWNEGTRPMTIPAIAGGLLAGWAATSIPLMAGWASGYRGLLAAGLTAVVGTVVVGKFVSKQAAIGFGIVGATVVVNRLLKTVVGMGVPYISDGIGSVLGGMGMANPLNQTEEEIFGVDGGYGGGFGVLEPTYMGHGSY